MILRCRYYTAHPLLTHSLLRFLTPRNFPCAMLAAGIWCEWRGCEPTGYEELSLTESEAGIQRGHLWLEYDENFCCHLSFFLAWTSTFVEFRTFSFPLNHCAERKGWCWGVLLFWGASEGRLWHLLFHRVPTMSFVQFYLPEVNYSGPEWAFLLIPWADFNYHPLPVWIEETRGTASLAAACKTHSETAVCTKAPFCVFGVTEPTNTSWILQILLFAWKETVHPQSGEPLGSCYTGFFCLFCFYIILRFRLIALCHWGWCDSQTIEHS